MDRCYFESHTNAKFAENSISLFSRRFDSSERSRQHQGERGARAARNQEQSSPNASRRGPCAMAAALRALDVRSASTGRTSVELKCTTRCSVNVRSPEAHRSAPAFATRTPITDRHHRAMQNGQHFEVSDFCLRCPANHGSQLY